MIYGVGSDLERKDFALTKDLTEIIAGMYVAKEKAVDFTEDSRDISWALFKTPQKYRVVLYLYYCEQYKVREIADILKISESAVKARLTRGREKLKEIYGGD